MLRELTIEIYLFIFRILFNIGKLFPLQKRALFITSFGHNTEYVARELITSTDEPIIILNTGSFEPSFLPKDQMSRITIKRFTPAHPIQWLQGIFLLTSSTTVYVDNYYCVLAMTIFKISVHCVQLWHSEGASILFLVNVPSNKNRTKHAINRLRAVYKRVDDVVIGYHEIGNILGESFGL